MKLHHTTIPFSASGPGATGYGADNLVLPQVLRPWRSVDLTQHQLVIDLGTVLTPGSLWLQDCDFTTAAIERNDGGGYVAVGTLTTYQDAGGRRKGLIEIPAACRYLRVTVPVQATTDGAGHYSVGAAYVFDVVEAAPRAPDWGLRPKSIQPGEYKRLSNGRPYGVALGARYMELPISISAGSGEDAARLLRLAAAGVVGLDLELPASGQCWPVTAPEPDIEQTLERLTRWPVSFTLTEVV